MGPANNTLLHDLRTNREFLLTVLDQPIMFHKVYIKITHSVTAALVLSYAIQITDNLDIARGGWFVLDAGTWDEETGLSRNEQAGARRRLREMEILRERKSGMPTILEYKVDFSRIAELLHSYATSLAGCERHESKKPASTSGKSIAA